MRTALQDADRPASAAKLQSRGSRSVVDTSHDLARQQQRLPQPSLQFITSSHAPRSAMTSTAPPRDKPVPFEAWTDDSQCKRGMANGNILLRSLLDGCISSITRYCVVSECIIFIFSSAV